MTFFFSLKLAPREFFILERSSSGGFEGGGGTMCPRLDVALSEGGESYMGSGECEEVFCVL